MLDKRDILSDEQTTPLEWLAGHKQSQIDYFVEKRFYQIVKRAVESLIALVILVGLAPVWLLLALIIKLTSPGTVLYRGQVIGKHGRAFTYYKFRSMYSNNDNSKHVRFIRDYVGGTFAADSANDEPPAFKLTNDKRVTKVGYIIRRLSLDEVPQLWNVLRGEMAIVGPRPPLLYEYELYDEWSKQRLQVLPGITGLAQVRARNKVSFQQMVETDLEYIRQRSLWLDLKIMALTPVVMLKGV